MHHLTKFTFFLRWFCYQNVSIATDADGYLLAPSSLRQAELLNWTFTRPLAVISKLLHCQFLTFEPFTLFSVQKPPMCQCADHQNSNFSLPNYTLGKENSLGATLMISISTGLSPKPRWIWDIFSSLSYSLMTVKSLLMKFPAKIKAIIPQDLCWGHKVT